MKERLIKDQTELNWQKLTYQTLPFTQGVFELNHFKVDKYYHVCCCPEERTVATDKADSCLRLDRIQLLHQCRTGLKILKSRCSHLDAQYQPWSNKTSRCFKWMSTTNLCMKSQEHEGGEWQLNWFIIAWWDCCYSENGCWQMMKLKLVSVQSSSLWLNFCRCRRGCGQKYLWLDHGHQREAVIHPLGIHLWYSTAELRAQTHSWAHKGLSHRERRLCSSVVVLKTARYNVAARDEFYLYVYLQY